MRKAFIIIMLLVVATILFFYLLNPSLNTKKYPLNFLSLNQDSKNIVVVYYETEIYNDFYRVDPGTGNQEYSEAHEITKGYLVELVNPINGNLLSSIRIERKPDEISATKVFITKDNKVYLVYTPSSGSKSEPFIEVISLKDDKLTMDIAPKISGFKLKEYNETNAKLINEFNEVFVLDFETGSLQAESKSDNKKVKSKSKMASQFFFAKYLPNSTRHIPYFLKYTTDDNYFSGTPGDMLNVLIQSPYDMSLDYNPSQFTKVSSKESINMYSSKIKKPEILKELLFNNKQQILNRPNVVFVSDSTCLLMAENKEEKQVFYFMTQDSISWSIDVPKTEKKILSVSLVKRDNDFIISSDKDWIMKLSNEGKVKWKYPN